MTFSTRTSLSLLGSLALATASGGVTSAAEYGRAQFMTNASRCSGYGPDYAAVEGSDTCVRIGGHVRVQMGTTAGLSSATDWGNGQASSATLHSDGPDQQAGPTRHLRVQGGLGYPNPFH